MFHWRITKYNPQFRDKNGAYLKDEWTSYSEIGRVYDGKIFTLEEYLKVEDAYIQAILLFMECLNLNSLKISSLEKDGRRPKKSVMDDGTIIINNSDVNKEAIIKIAQLILRCKTWCTFESNEMSVRFGYDYYMFIKSAKPCDSVIEQIKNSGLYVEPYDTEIED